MSLQNITKFQGWGISNIEQHIKNIALSPIPPYDDETYEELCVFIDAYFDTADHPVDQSLKYVFIEASIGGLQTSSPANTGISFYISRRMSMALQANYQVVIDELVSVLKEYIEWSPSYVLNPNVSIRDYVTKIYQELNVTEIF